MHALIGSSWWSARYQARPQPSEGASVSQHSSSGRGGEEEAQVDGWMLEALPRSARPCCHYVIQHDRTLLDFSVPVRVGLTSDGPWWGEIKLFWLSSCSNQRCTNRLLQGGVTQRQMTTEMETKYKSCEQRVHCFLRLGAVHVRHWQRARGRLH